MMRFNIAGEYLELPADFSLTFKKTNVLFAFDKIECERSTSFDVPATPKNDRIFGLARVLYNTGAGMRTRYAAQLQGSVVSKNGYLYVSSAERGKYHAVFVTGELLGLQAIKDAGKVADVISDESIISWGNLPYTPANARTTEWAQIKYASDNEQPLPSVRLHTILASALTALGVSFALPAAPQYVRYIPQELKGIRATDDEFTGTGGSMSYDTETWPVCYRSSLDILYDMFYTDDAHIMRIVNPESSTNRHFYRGSVRQLQARQQIQITFPDDWNDNLFIGYFLNGGTNLLAEFTFLGDRSFDTSGTITGESLRGRSVTIERGGHFTIIHKDDYFDGQTSSGHEVGWGFSSNYGIINIEGGEIDLGSAVRLSDNLPDVTVTELLKIYAALAGAQLYYTDAQGVTFDALDFTNWGTIDLTGKVLSIGTVTRTFSDYAQVNKVLFETDDEVTEAQRIETNYTIINDNLDTDKELQKIPFSEGASAGAYDDRTLIYTNASALADAGVNSPAMTRVLLPKNANLQRLCDTSTATQMRVRMSLLEYERITPKTRLYYAGAYFVWTELQFSKGVVTMKLSRT